MVILGNVSLLLAAATENTFWWPIGLVLVLVGEVLWLRRANGRGFGGGRGDDRSISLEALERHASAPALQPTRPERV